VIAKRRAVAALVLLSILLLASCGSAQRALMYYPSQDLPSPKAAGVPEMAVVRLETADGLALVSWYAWAVAPGRPTIVYFQGNAGNLAGRAVKVRSFLDRGYGVLLVGYRGYGGNPGVPSERGLVADGHAALGFLAGRGVPSEQMVLLGESLGSAVAVRLAGESTVGAVILEAPFTSAADAAQQAFPLLPVTPFIEDPYDSLSRIDRIGAPLLIVHGEQDRIVPVDQGRHLLAAAQAPKQGVFLPFAGHNDLYHYGSDDIVVAFLERLFGA
jgi:fermentation-respiration switch protein FrsA (DUF1100 family)